MAIFYSKMKSKVRNNRVLIAPLLLCLLVSLIWPASFLIADRLTIRHGTDEFQLATGPGWVRYSHDSHVASLDQPRFHNSCFALDAQRRNLLQYPGVYRNAAGYRCYLPLWLIAAGAMLFASGLIISHIRLRLKFKPGCCPQCGYDLRFSPERCPECGRPREGALPLANN
jgi:hypothetical protein